MIKFSPTNVAEFLNYPRYPKIKGTRLEREIDLNEMARVLIGDNEATWPTTNQLNAAKLVTCLQSPFLSMLWYTTSHF